jgi:hypothetical protein
MLHGHGAIVRGCRSCGLTVELSGARADVCAWHFILHAESSFEKVDTHGLDRLSFKLDR